MTLILSHTSALEFWRAAESATLSHADHAAKDADTGKPTAAQVNGLRQWGSSFLSDPVHLLVDLAGSRCRGIHSSCHLHSSRLPPDSFVRVDDDVIVCRPELCFVQMATKMSFPQLLELGFELCGTYNLPSEGSKKAFQRNPLTSVESLSLFIDVIDGLRGTVDARRALPYIVEGSASPRETILTLLLCLPLRLGGCGLPQPELNHQVFLDEIARRATGKKSLRCDLYWPAARLAVEYDSDLHHTGGDRIADDATRRAVLANMGIGVVTVTRRQVTARSEFALVVQLLARHLGKRNRKTRRTWAIQEQELRSQLLGIRSEDRRVP